MGKYENKIFTHPVWEGDIVYNETVWPLDEADGDIEIGLLYPIEEIISVTDTRLEKTFVSGRDYRVENGNFVIVRSGEIPITPWNEFQLDHEQEDATFKIGCSLGGWLYFAEGDQITKKQIAITYRHSGKWCSYIPSSEPDKLPLTKKKLAEHKPFTFAFFGDSITYGCNSSGLKDIMVPPYAPIWSDMTVEALNERGEHVKHINRAVGGMDSKWGADKAYELFKDDAPDLFLIAFGMNDPVNTYFGENTEKMIEDVLKINPDCEFLLVSTMLPHKLAAGFFRGQVLQQGILEKICEKYGNKAALVPMSDVHAALLTRKRFCDMTGNNVNHPNDFLAGIHAQTILEILK